MTHPIRVGHIDLSFHDAPAREVDRILRARGHRIERSATPHGGNVQADGRGRGRRPGVRLAALKATAPI
jgi:glycine betaine/proline transport system substrate-binding protein